jgi:hypothetical protein
MPITELTALGGLVTGCIGMVLGLLNYIRARESTEAFISDAREARKAAVSSDFLKEFYGPEFMVVRSQSWDEVHEFCRNDGEGLGEGLGDRAYGPWGPWGRGLGDRA